eukprot:6311451-Lingulodinium_polyedra.AAC.1
MVWHVCVHPKRPAAGIARQGCSLLFVPRSVDELIRDAPFASHSMKLRLRRGPRPARPGRAPRAC